MWPIIPQISPEVPAGATAKQRKEKQLDFGVAAMVVMDFEPFSVVNRWPHFLLLKL